jgi:transmembrane sensor
MAPDLIPDSIPKSDIDLEALAWQQLLAGDTVSGEDWAGYAAWLEQSPAHREAADAVALLAHDLDTHRDTLMPNKITDTGPVDLTSYRLARTQKLFSGRRLVAAGLALAACLAVFLVAPRLLPVGPAAQNYVTAKGAQQFLKLADGSRVSLNTNTRLIVQLDNKLRRVELASGEASFEVAHDPSRPFVIAAGDSQVRVIGTSFNILRHLGQLTVTVQRGIVEVGAAGQAARAAWTGAARLTAGKQLVHMDGSGTAVVHDVDARAIFAWQQRQLVYQNQTLRAVVADLNRYFTVPVRLADAHTGTLRFSGVLMLDKEAVMLGRLEQFLPVTTTRTATDFVLHARIAKN